VRLEVANFCEILPMYQIQIQGAGPVIIKQIENREEGGGGGESDAAFL